MRACACKCVCVSQWKKSARRMASTTSDTGDTSSKQQQAQRKENYNKRKRPVSSVDHCHPYRRKKEKRSSLLNLHMLQSTCFGTEIETGVDSKDDSGSQGQYREERREVRGKMTLTVEHSEMCVWVCDCVWVWFNTHTHTRTHARTHARAHTPIHQWWIQNFSEVGGGGAGAMYSMFFFQARGSWPRSRSSPPPPPFFFLTICFFELT